MQSAGLKRSNSVHNKSGLNVSQQRSVTPTRLGNLSNQIGGLRSNKSVPFGLNTSNKSPSRNIGGGLIVKANRSINKTPNKLRATQRVLGLTPSRNTSLQGLNISSSYQGDRFIPIRSDRQHLLSSSMSSSASNSNLRGGTRSAPGSPEKDDYEQRMRMLLNDGVSGPSSTSSLDTNGEAPVPLQADSGGYRILAFRKGDAPRAPLGFANNQKVLYSARAAPASSCQKSVRRIPTQAERILDAPDIADDFYCNLIDWGSNDMVIVALGTCVYMWKASTGDIAELYSLPADSVDMVCSVAFSNDASYATIGLSTGEILVYDTTTKARLRKLKSHTSRVAAVSWNAHILSSGDKQGGLHHSDVRVAQHHVHTSEHHLGEVCGLRWSPDGRHLASGSNDNTVAVWSMANLSTNQPLHVVREHTAAVKALAWCPWQSSVLATGGGTSDRFIRLTNVQTQTEISALDTESQISSIIWSDVHRELLIGTGYPTNHLAIYKYPSMKIVQELKGHDGRILNVVPSPCGQFVMSASADETLRMWHCFAVDAKQMKGQPGEKAKRSKPISQLDVMRPMR